MNPPGRAPRPPAERHYRWEWMLRSNPEALWPFVADTNRFNWDAGVPQVELVVGAPLPNARRRLRLFRLGVPVEWDEEPFEWVWPSRFGVVRRYAKGPVAELRVRATLEPGPSGGTRLGYEVWARPRNLLGRAAIPIDIGWRAARRFEATVRRYDAEALARTPTTRVPAAVPPRGAGPVLAHGGAARIAAAAESLRRGGCPADLVARLVQTIERADDLTLVRLRPYVLADHWGAPRRAVLELCLLATRAGLLDLSWDLLCPLCRGAKASHSQLAEVDPEVHCDTCQIDFRADFDRLVELTFRPSPAVRRVVARAFCVGGPGVTPHVVLQQLLAPGTTRAVAARLEPGRYRARALGQPGAQFLRVEAGGDGAATGATAPTLRVSDGGWPEGELAVGPRPTLQLANATSTEALVLLERLQWTDEAATAAEVTALQRFRDLFASDVLRPGEQIAVGSLAFLFTDLRGSTRLYREVGDASAFGRVMSHFDVLREAVTREGGAIVKTMGDAIMAAFPRPAAALRAALAAQQALGPPTGGVPSAAPPVPLDSTARARATRASGGLALRLRAGVHVGPCIAVTQNGRLDYFGSVVNVAARLEGLSQGGDVVLSAEARADPEVSDWLDRADSTLVAEPFEDTLKGFDTERFTLWRVAPSAREGGLAERARGTS